MVDSISSSVARLRALQNGSNETDSPRVGAGPRASATRGASQLGSDAVQLNAATRMLPPAGTPEAPIDLQAVAEIKEAISKGNYPIDKDRLAERLFQSYYELTL